VGVKHLMAASILLISGTTVSQDATAAEPSAAKPARVISTLVKRAAIVEAVNRETRELKLIDAQGNRFSITVSDAVRNFDQIEPRDRIVAEYLESVAVVIAPVGAEPPIGDAEYFDVAPAGDKPALEGVETRLVTATVHAINAADRLLTLETDDGELRTIKVRADAPLDSVTVGDQFRLRITRAIAVSVVEPESN